MSIPTEQHHYADPSINTEEYPIDARVDRVHHPTLGCPALLGPGDELEVLLSLPAAQDTEGVHVALVDRHGSTDAFALQYTAERLEPGPDGQRVLWRLRCSTVELPRRLYDLRVAWPGGQETQHNAVRLYGTITGREKVVLCGDTQYHVDNQVCFERFIERMNARDDVAWIALIGDVCDNGVKGSANVIKLGILAGESEVDHYYGREYPGAHALLCRLRHPVVLVPGNHDGMCHLHRYGEGSDSDVYLGPDPVDRVACDGLHHWRRTFGPLYFRFDWGGTRYFCLNSFELERRWRLGFHAVVANWGGWIRPEQLAWFERELTDATAQGMRKVVLMHHDPRGGAKGRKIGRYHDVRRYRYTSMRGVVGGYLSYLFKHGSGLWQQEWMVPEDMDIEDHPVQQFLELLVVHRVHAVVMGHDNENWVDSYSEGDDIFAADNEPLAFFDDEGVDISDEARSLAGLLEDDLEEATRVLDGLDEEAAEALLAEALEVEVDAEDDAFAFGPDELPPWDLVAQAPLHFVHVDDVGAYKYAKEKHLNHYGYVLAHLDGGLPVRLRNHHLGGAAPGPEVVLPHD